MKACGEPTVVGEPCVLPAGHTGDHLAQRDSTYKMGDLAIVMLDGRTFWHRVTANYGRLPDFPGPGWTEYIGGLAIDARS